MIIGGFQKFSLIDFPGKTCAIIFTKGCNFRCRYCHNAELCDPNRKGGRTILLSEIYDFLNSRCGKLDAVTITGGEPTQHPDLAKVIREIKDMGFLVKLDSNGSRPEMLEGIIDERLVDYLAMDVKTSLVKYPKIMGRFISPEVLRKSINLIINSGIDHEFRTTIAKTLTTKEDLYQIAQIIKGANNYYLQRFSPSTKMNDQSLMSDISYSDEELHDWAQELSKFVKGCYVR